MESKMHSRVEQYSTERAGQGTAGHGRAEQGREGKGRT